MGQAWCKSDEERNSLLDSLHRCAMGRCSLVDPRSIRNREGAHSARITATNPLDLYYMPYTHSLVAAIGWSVVGAAAYRVAAPSVTKRAAAVIGAAVFSHWVLDLLVHRPDLPLYDNSAKVGLGLWNVPAIALGLEAALLFGGMWLYFRLGTARRAALLAFGGIMLAIQAYVFFGPPPASDNAAAFTALVSYAVFALIIRALERRSMPA